MADFTMNTLASLADDAVIRNIFERRKILRQTVIPVIASDSLLLAEIVAKYANINRASDLRAIVEQLITADDDEIKRRVREILPPAV